MSDPLDPIARLNRLLQFNSFFAPESDVGVILRPYKITTYTEGRTVGYRLFVEAVDPCNMPAEIFVYQRKPILYQNLNYKDDFSNIASYPDLEEYPPFEPEGDSPFFRLSTVDLVFRNLDLLADALADIYSDVAELVIAIRANNELGPLGDLTVGNVESCQSSSSSSSSSSGV